MPAEWSLLLPMFDAGWVGGAFCIRRRRQGGVHVETEGAAQQRSTTENIYVLGVHGKGREGGPVGLHAPAWCLACA